MSRFNIYLDKKALTLHEAMAIREDRYEYLTKRVKQVIEDSKTTDLTFMINEVAKSCQNARELVFGTIGVCRNTNKYYIERKPNKYLEQLLENFNKSDKDEKQAESVAKNIIKWLVITLLVSESVALMLMGLVTISILIAIIAMLLIL